MPETRNLQEALIKWVIEQTVTSGRGYKPRVNLSSELKDTREGLRRSIFYMDYLDERGSINPAQNPIIISIYDPDKRPIYVY